jgi:hypothetical protein
MYVAGATEPCIHAVVKAAAAANLEPQSWAIDLKMA